MCRQLTLLLACLALAFPAAAQFKVYSGATSYTGARIRIVDSTDFTPETGVVYNTSGIDIEYQRDGAASQDITEVTQTAGGAYSEGGFVHLGNGYYRVDVPDAAIAAGVAGCMVHGTVTGMIVIGCYIQIDTNTAQTGDSYARIGAAGAGLTALGDTRIANLDAAVSSRSDFDESVDKVDLVDAPNATALAAIGTSVWASGTRTLTSFGTLAADVWASATRTLTAFSFGVQLAASQPDYAPNTVAPLDAAGVRTALGLSAADLDTQLAAILEDTGTSIPATLSALATAAALSNLDADVTTVDGVVDAILTVVAKVDTALELDGAVYRYTANALELGPGGGGGGDASEAKQDVLLARLGAWTGTGDNTILGGLQALARSDGPAVSDLGGTYDAGTDSQQAIRDRGDVAWSSSPGGVGAVEIDHNYGGADELLFEDAAGAAVGGALIRLYLAADYGTTGQTLLGYSVTTDDGRWAWPVYGDDAVDYTLVVEPPVGRGVTKVIEIAAAL